MPVFPILRSIVHILRRFLKILRRCASVRVQLLESLVLTVCVGIQSWYDLDVNILGLPQQRKGYLEATNGSNGITAIHLSQPSTHIGGSLQNMFFL